MMNPRQRAESCDSGVSLRFKNTRLVLSALRDYVQEQKKTVFIVTHENDAMQYADRSFRMDGGQLITAADRKRTEPA